MKRFALLALVVAALSAAFFMSNSTAQEKSAAAKAAPYRHVVMLKFKDGTEADRVTAVVEAFKALQKKLPAVQSLEWGTNVSPEKHDNGFTHIFTLTFENKEALEKHYINEQAHKDFGGLLVPVLDKVMVLDYVAQ
jgi:hypothetical protein